METMKNNRIREEKEMTVLGQIERELDESMRVRGFWHTNYQHGSLFAPGALGGILDFHFSRAEFREDLENWDSKKPEKEAPANPDGEELEIASEILAGHRRVAEQKLGERLQEKGAVELEKYLAALVEKSPDSKESARILEFAKYCLFHSANEQVVRTGLILLAQFKNPDQETLEALTDLAMYDEFTKEVLAVIYRMRGEEGFDDLVFEILRHTYGWGRVEGMDYWKPEKPEMRQWLLMGGFRNEILPDYTINRAVIQSNVVERLEGDMMLEEFRYAGEMIRALFADHGLNGGAIMCICDLNGQECGERLLLNYLKKWKAWMSVPGIADTPVFREGLMTIHNIWNGVLDEEEMEKVAEEVKKAMQWLDAFCGKTGLRMRAIGDEELRRMAESWIL